MKRRYEQISSLLDQSSDESDQSSQEKDESDEEILTTSSKMSIFDPTTYGDKNINSGGRVLFSTTLPCKKPEDPKKPEKFKIIKFNNDDYIKAYFMKRDRNLVIGDYVDFDESKCFFCNWFAIIEKETVNKEQVLVVHNIYPNIGPRIYNELMGLIEKCADDFRLTPDAHNYYKAYIMYPFNRNTKTDKNCKKELFPDKPEYEVYLHATHDRIYDRKLRNLGNSFIDCSKYIVENMGIIKEDTETGEKILDKDLVKSVESLINNSIKIFGMVEKKQNNINISHIKNIKNISHIKNNY